MNEKPEFSLVRPCAELIEQYLDLCRESWGHVHDNYILSDPAQYDLWRHSLLEKYRKPYDVVYTNFVGTVVYEDDWQIAVAVSEGKMI